MKVSLAPRQTLIRPEVLSIAMGIFWAFCVLLLTMAALAGQGTPPTPAPGFFIELFLVIFPGYAIAWHGLISGFLWGFVYGYFFGFLIGYFYSLLIRRDSRSGAAGVLDLFADRQPLVLQAGIGERPYTIAFVANPMIEVLDEENNREGPPLRDPVMDDPRIFFQAVVRCLRSFAGNELTRLPEIIHQLRILLFFDPRAENPAAFDPEQDALIQGLVRSTNILSPRRDGEEGVRTIDEYVRRYTGECPDIVFLISGSPDFTRSSARLTEDDITPPANPPGASSGVPFGFTFNDDMSQLVAKEHSYYAKLPGVVAYWAFDDRLKTSIHEFAHAMSSLENGAIDDEYINETFASMAFRVNKKFRGGFLVTAEALRVLGDPAFDLLPAVLADLHDDPDVFQKHFDRQADFIAAIEVHIITHIPNSASEAYEKHLLFILKYCRYNASFRVDERTLDNIRNEAIPDSSKQILLEVLGQKPFFDESLRRGEVFSERSGFLQVFQEQLAEYNQSNTIAGGAAAFFARHKSLALRHAHFKIAAVPKTYAHYQAPDGEISTYYTDRFRADKDIGWESYVPERLRPGMSCIMDVSHKRARFDKLLFDFMYDRLMAKINRPARDNCIPPSKASKEATS